MSPRSLFLCATLAITLVALSAQAHDTTQYPMRTPKQKPTTCGQLADTERYSVYQAERELRERCEADAKAAEADRAATEAEASDT